MALMPGPYCSVVQAIRATDSRGMLVLHKWHSYYHCGIVILRTVSTVRGCTLTF